MSLLFVLLYGLVLSKVASHSCGTLRVEGDRGAGAWESRGREGYGRREKKGREVGLPKWWEPGEKEKNIAILRNISQQK